MCRVWLTVRRVTLGFYDAMGRTVSPSACNAGFLRHEGPGRYRSTTNALTGKVRLYMAIRPDC